jgi:CheY-like chemotaxis protein
MTKQVILVVDDDADIRSMLCELLASEGYGPSARATASKRSSSSAESHRRRCCASI